MILKKLTTGFVLMGTLLLAPAEAAAAVRAHVGIRFGHRPLYAPARIRVSVFAGMPQPG